MEAHGGLITKAGSRRLSGAGANAVKGTYRGYEIISMPPPSSGGVALVEMLNILEPLRPEVEGPADGAGSSPRRSKRCAVRIWIARAASAIRISSKVPVAELISKRHARRVGATIDLAKASNSVELGRDIVDGTARAGTGRDDALLGASIAPAWPSRAPTRSKAASGRTSSSAAPASSSTTRWGTSTRSPAMTEPQRRYRHAGQPDRHRESACSAR